MKIWFRLVEAFKSYRSDKPNDTDADADADEDKIFKVRSRSSPIGELNKWSISEICQRIN